jgi:hypothetical protein
MDVIDDVRVLLDRIEDLAHSMDVKYQQTGKLNRARVDELQHYVACLYTELGVQRERGRK